jgi:hypothetical protein
MAFLKLLSNYSPPNIDTTSLNNICLFAYINYLIPFTLISTNNLLKQKYQMEKFTFFLD